MKKFSLLVSASFLLFACKENAVIKDKNDAAMVNAASSNSNISFKVNGETVRTSGWNISRLIWKPGEKQWLNITTNMHEDKRTILANLDGIVAGTYPLIENGGMRSSHADYKPDYSGDMMNSYSFVSGSFVLTEVDTVHNKINGNFSGKVKNSKGEILEITEGKILNAEMKEGVMSY
ncbi:MAG: hypothetical protein ACJ749_14405 [Flavisolibacter sp.]